LHHRSQTFRIQKKLRTKSKEEDIPEPEFLYAINSKIHESRNQNEQLSMYKDSVDVRVKARQTMVTRSSPYTWQT